jgi:alkylation response protein AidB-like acyl-CoA dehydrogenase
MTTDTTPTNSPPTDEATRQDLLATVRRFTREQVVPAAARHDAEDTYPAELVGQMADLGLFGITVPEEYGGLGLDLDTYVAIVEELAWGWMSVTGFLNTHVMVCHMVRSFGTEEQKRRLLPRLASGEVRGAYSMSEPDAGSDVAAITTRAVRDGDEWVVNGTKAWVTNGRMAGVVAVLVRTPDDDAPPDGPRRGHRDLTVLLVEKDPGADRFGGITVGANIHKLGYRGIETVEVSYDDHRLPADAVLGGEPGRGFAHMMAAVELGRVNIAARAIGVAQRALDESLAYARTRTTFGRPIAEHQAVAFRLAEMATKVTAGRLLYQHAAAAKAAGRADLSASMAKLFCSETCWEVCADALRIHGGNGYATEYPVERLYRDAPLMVIGDGTSEIQKLVISRRLLELEGGT